MPLQKFKKTIVNTNQKFLLVVAALFTVFTNALNSTPKGFTPTSLCNPEELLNHATSHEGQIENS